MLAVCQADGTRYGVQKIAPCLWFDRNCEEAVNFYLAVFPNSKITTLKRYPADTDLGCLLCFNEADGKFLWQHSSEKLAAGRVNDWPMQGICCAPYIEGKRGWFVTSRGEVVCFDTEGFYDGEEDGPVTGVQTD